MYPALKFLHMTLAFLAIGGFVLRGYWHWSGSALSDHRLTKILPHINDTLFLFSGIALIHVLGLPWLQLPWLHAKFAGLGAYIVFGMLAFRWTQSAPAKLVAFSAAVASFAYVVGAALAKSPLAWLAY